MTLYRKYSGYSGPMSNLIHARYNHACGSFVTENGERVNKQNYHKLIRFQPN